MSTQCQLETGSLTKTHMKVTLNSAMVEKGKAWIKKSATCDLIDSRVAFPSRWCVYAPTVAHRCSIVLLNDRTAGNEAAADARPAIKKASMSWRLWEWKDLYLILKERPVKDAAFSWDSCSRYPLHIPARSKNNFFNSSSQLLKLDFASIYTNLTALFLKSNRLRGWC